MKLLALDTSSDACSVALQCDGRLIERHRIEAREHTRLLVPMIEEVLADGGITPRQLDAIVVGNGPGSFIGMRIGASVAQGIAYGAGLEVVPVSSLAAVAAEVFHATAERYVMVAQDAHMNEVYLAGFTRGKDGLPCADGATTLQPIGRIARFTGRGAGRVPAAGAGWQRYPQLLELNEDRIAAVLDVAVPRAAFLLGAGAAAFREGALLEPERLAPDYVRSTVASAPTVRDGRDAKP